MNCPNCGASINQNDAFCGGCGAQLSQQAAEQPTQQMPAAQQPPQQPTQQMPVTPQAPSAPQPGAAPPPPPSNSGKTVAIIIVILALLGMCACAGIAGWFYYISQAEDALEVIETIEPVEPDTSSEPMGYASAEEALLSELPTDWVYDLAADTPDYAEYWAGPPASEYMSVYIVERAIDGTWYVSESYDYEMGLDDEVFELTEADMAQVLVEDFLSAIMADMPDDAQALTVSPFADDPASASYSNGDFYSYYVDEVIDEGDGTYWVIVTEEWAYGTDVWQYHVVPTELGWRINELAPY